MVERHHEERDAQREQEQHESHEVAREVQDLGVRRRPPQLEAQQEAERFREEMRERMDRRQDALAADELLLEDDPNWDVDQ